VREPGFPRPKRGFVSNSDRSLIVLFRCAPFVVHGTAHASKRDLRIGCDQGEFVGNRCGGNDTIGGVSMKTSGQVVLSGMRAR
jgi:hypothetical protein